MSCTTDVKIKANELDVEVKPQQINFNFIHAAIGFGYTQGKLEFKQDTANIDFGLGIEAHTHTESEITDLNKYTQQEINELLLHKSNTGHTHDGIGGPIAQHDHTESDILDLDKYTQGQINIQQAAQDNIIATNRGLFDNHVGSLDNPHQTRWDTLIGRPGSYPPDAHDHDSRYYTETEIDQQQQTQDNAHNSHLVDFTNSHKVTALQTGASPSDHIHDTRYYTHAEVSALVAAKSASYETFDEEPTWNIGDIWLQKGAQIPIFDSANPIADMVIGVNNALSYNVTPHFIGEIAGYSLNGASSWLSIDNNGILSGIPFVVETSIYVTIVGVNPLGNAISNQFQVTVTA